MSLTTRVLIGLVAGFLLGLALTGVAASFAAPVLAVATPVGTIFVNLIRMTVIPLVVSMLIANVGTMTSSASLGRTGMRGAALAIAMLVVTAVATVLVAAPILAHLQVDQTAAMALRRSATDTIAASARPSGAGSASPLAEWF